MRLQIRSRHGHVTDSVRRYAEEKVGKLGKRVHELTVVELTLSRQHNPSIADDHTAEAVVRTKGSTIVVRERATTWEAAVDRLVDKLERQVERYRDKRTHEQRRRMPQAAEAGSPPAADSEREESAA
jgi:putative sigma-54 modulation protein